MPETPTKASLILNYRERHCLFTPDTQLIDEKIIDHGQTKPHLESQSRHRPTHKNPGNICLTASLTRVQYGSYRSQPACLITFRFQFHGSTPRWDFEKAEIRLCFTSTSTSATSSANEPIIADYGPKSLSSTDSNSQYTAMLSSGLSALPPTALSAIHATPHTHHIASTISSTSLPSKGHESPNTVRFWIREDMARKDGLPFELDCAVVVKHAGPIQGTVDVKVGPVFEFLARPWKDGDAVMLKAGWDFGELVRGSSDVDFAELNVEEWRAMVTPRLSIDMRQVLHGRQRT